MAKKSKRATKSKRTPRVLTVEQGNALKETRDLNGRYLVMKIYGEPQCVWIRFDPDEIDHAIRSMSKASDGYASTLGHFVQLKNMK